ncbi:uncharacterized protein yc1106_05108 [Curvularia clavata]|uniref:Rhodopsin domain-containing protein n=1 Tax=Curvularia clavata TaxID=95742 RepID=A0A9Q8Z875_CURCL|nr:uncharacterized protein yc1106_05108 [Curvularia clavata]
MTGTYLNPNGKGSSGILAPLEVVAQWPKPNYDNPVRRPKIVVPLVCILGTVMLAIVGARTWARFVIQKNGKMDDWFMLLAMVPAIGFAVVVVLATEVYNFDRHIWDVRPPLYPVQRKIVFLVYLLYVLTSSLIKISVLLFYRRLDSRSISRTFRLATHLSILFILIFLAAFTIVLCTGCQPLEAFWNQFDVKLQLEGYAYTCWYNEEADIMAATTISAVQDAITAGLPTLLYWGLRIPRRQKIALTAVFAASYIVVAVCVVRVYVMWEIFNNPLYDGTWTTWPALLLVILEVNLGAILASIPALKVFARHYFEGSVVGGSRDGISRQRAGFRGPSDVVELSVLSRTLRGDEEGDLALLDFKKSETRDERLPI